jgi:hypothetical protein
MRKIACYAALLSLCVAAVPAWAQQRQERAQTPGPANQAAPQSQQVTVASQPGTPTPNEWAVSGFAGPGFGEAFEGTEMGFGGSVAFLHNRRFGAEFLANITPGIGDEAASVVESNVNNYMGNVIAAIPLGRDGRIQPFVSGGIGAMRLKADVEQTLGDDIVEVDDTRLGANAGVGLMWFQNRWGLRTDLRYFRAIDNDDEFDPDDEVQLPVGTPGLTDTTFWRYDLGVAYRW